MHSSNFYHISRACHPQDGHSQMASPTDKHMSVAVWELWVGGKQLPALEYGDLFGLEQGSM